MPELREATVPAGTTLVRVDRDGTPIVTCQTCGGEYAVNYHDRPCPRCQARTMPEPPPRLG